jgi:tetratricopeptide (TPR) repeat protein
MKFIALILLSFSVLLTACDNGKSVKDNNSEKQLNPIEAAQKKIQDDPDNADLHFQLAQLYQAKKDPNNAIISLQKAIEIEPEQIPYYLLMADLYMELGQLKNTMVTLQQASVIDGQNTDIMLKTAEIYFMFKKYTETFEFVNKALEIEPHNDRAFFLRGHTYKEMGDTARAIKNFMDCINNNPQNFNANLELGILFAANHDRLAIDYYGNAMKIDSTRIEPYYNLGMFYQEHQMENEAIAIYKLLIDFAPEFEHAPYNIGYIMLEVLQLPDEALPYFTQAIEINPNYYQAYFNRGLCYEMLGNIAMARQEYTVALKLKTNYQNAIEALNRLDRGDQFILEDLQKQ